MTHTPVEFNQIRSKAILMFYLLLLFCFAFLCVNHANSTQKESISPMQHDFNSFYQQ